MIKYLVEGSDTMSFYLNKNINFSNYVNDPIFIDKSNLIVNTNNYLSSPSMKFMCVTRPRRFGKTMTLSMLNAYYSKGCDSKVIFDKLNIANDSSYIEHLNKHNVIWIDMSSLYTGLNDKSIFVQKLKEFI